VVSEERGTIMVAQDGKTTYLKNVVELRTLMERYFEIKIDARSKILTKKRFRQNTLEKAIAIVLALGLWFIFGHQRESVQRDYIIPIEYRKVSQDWEIEESRATQATVTLMGSSQAFSLFDPNSIKASIDLSSIVEGRQTIMLSSDMVNIPSNITVVKFKPDTILIAAHRLYTREARAVIDTPGPWPTGDDIQKITVEPETLVVLAPFAITGNRIYITTEPIDLTGITASQTFNMRLVYPNRIRFKNNQAPLVKVTLEVERAKGNQRAGSRN
jgi:YbbR domain-containing protein